MLIVMERYYIHGEFGVYREKLVAELLKNIIPQRLEIGTGFVITSTGKISTQCDIIIYDKNNSPLIKNDNCQTFFPIECVVAIGEIKSNLKKTNLKEALQKLAKNKLLRNEIPSNNPYIFKDFQCEKYNAKDNILDEVITFLICNKFDFIYDNIVNEMDEIYDNCENYLRHNMVLSIEDGVLMYKGFPKENQFACYPIIQGKKLLNSLLKPYNKEDIEVKDLNIKCNKYEHIIAFLNYMYMGTSTTSILYPEMTNYLTRTRLNKTINETI